MRRPSFDFDRAFPLMAVIDDVIVSKRGEITVGWALDLPEAFSMVAEDYEDMVGSFRSALRVLPPWAMVHRQDMFTEEEYSREGSSSFLGKSYESHFDGRRYLVHHSRIFVTMSSRASALKPNSSVGLKGIEMTSAMPSKEDILSFVAKADEFMSILTSGGRISASKFRTSDYLESSNSPGIIHSYMSMGQEGMMLGDITLNSNGMKAGANLVSAYVVCESDHIVSDLSSSARSEMYSTASSDIPLSLGSAVGIMLDCEHVVNHYLLVCPQMEEIRKMDGRRKRMSSNSRSRGNMVYAEEINEFINDAHSKALTTVKCHMNILTWGQESRYLEYKGKVSAALSSMGITCVEDTTDAAVLWYAAIPGASCELGKDNLMTMETGSALCMGVYETFSKGFDEGKLKLCDRLRHIPLQLDIQKTAQKLKYISNFNTFILGDSGSGKSFFTNLLLRNCYDAGESVFVIDVGDSYEGLCSVIAEESGGADGIYYTWDSRHPLSFSAFSDFRNWTGESGQLLKDNYGLSFFTSVLMSIWEPEGGWSSQTETVLDQMIVDFLQHWRRKRKSPALDDFASYIAQQVRPAVYSDKGYRCGDICVHEDMFNLDSFKLSLNMFTTMGPYGFLLNDPEPKDLFSSRFTVFEVDKISGDKYLYPICVLCIMNAFSEHMRKDDGFKVLAIDEAWRAIANKTMSPFLAGMFKTSRKYSTSAIVITQQLSDIMNSEVVKDTILNNSAVKILLAQTGGVNFMEVADMLGLDERYRGLIQSMNKAIKPGLNYKEVFIKMGERKAGVYSTEVSAEEAVAYESEKGAKRRFLDLSSEIGAIEAIRKVSYEKTD